LLAKNNREILQLLTGDKMVHRKSVKELEKILSFFKSRSAKYDEDPKRDKRRDYKLMSQSE